MFEIKTKIIKCIDKSLRNYGYQVSQIVQRERYPDVEEILDDEMSFKKETIALLEQFKKMKPHQGNLEEIKNKYIWLNRELAKVYNLEEPYLIFAKKYRYGSCFIKFGNIIILEMNRPGKFSIMTFLHEFRHAMGGGEYQACKWSINLYRKIFPKIYEKLVPIGHLLYTAESAEQLKKQKENSDTFC